MKILIRLVSVMLLVVMVGCVEHRRLGVVAPEVAPVAPGIQSGGVALVLGGGGAKGMVHVGVLEVFEEAGIEVDYIVGCSSGSMVGAFYADGVDPKYMRDLFMGMGKWDLLDVSLFNALSGAVSTWGAVSGYKLEELVKRELSVVDIEDLKIPYMAVATDIVNNKQVVLRSGPVAPAVHASCSVPAVFSAVDLYGHRLVDGGVLEPVPVETARKFNPRVVIAVNICSPPDEGPVKNMVDLTYRANHITYYELAKRQAADADVVIHPNLMGYGMFDDTKSTELYEAGKEAARAALPEVRRVLRR